MRKNGKFFQNFFRPLIQLRHGRKSARKKRGPRRDLRRKSGGGTFVKRCAASALRKTVSKNLVREVYRPRICLRPVFVYRWGARCKRARGIFREQSYPGARIVKMLDVFSRACRGFEFRGQKWLQNRLTPSQKSIKTSGAPAVQRMGRRYSKKKAP